MYVQVRGPLPQPQLPPTSSENGSSQGQWFTAEEAKVANEDSANARQRGKVANVVETAFSRAAAHGGTMQLRSKRGRGGGMLQGLSGLWKVLHHGDVHGHELSCLFLLKHIPITIQFIRSA